MNAPDDPERRARRAASRQAVEEAQDLLSRVRAADAAGAVGVVGPSLAAAWVSGARQPAVGVRHVDALVAAGRRDEAAAVLRALGPFDEAAHGRWYAALCDAAGVLPDPALLPDAEGRIDAWLRRGAVDEAGREAAAGGVATAAAWRVRCGDPSVDPEDAAVPAGVRALAAWQRGEGALADTLLAAARPEDADALAVGALLARDRGAWRVVRTRLWDAALRAVHRPSPGLDALRLDAELAFRPWTRRDPCETWQHGHALRLLEAAAGHPVAPSDVIDLRPRAIRAPIRRAVAGYLGRAGVVVGVPSVWDGGRVRVLPWEPSPRAVGAGRVAAGLAWPDVEAFAGMDALIDEAVPHPHALTYAGEVRLTRGDLDGARDRLARAIAVSRWTRWAWMGLSLACVLAGDAREGARVLARRPWGLAPIATGHIYEAEVAWALGRRASALRSARRACDGHPRRVGAWALRGLATDDPSEREVCAAQIADLVPALWDDAWDATGARPAVDDVLATARHLLGGCRSSHLQQWQTPDGARWRA